MKKLAFVFILFSLATCGFSQQIAQVLRNQKSMVKKCEVSSIIMTNDQNPQFIQVDIFFSAPVDSRSLNENSIFINSKPLSKDTKITFNREATQARFSIKAEFPVTIKMKDIKNTEGNSIPETNAILKGVGTWTAR